MSRATCPKCGNTDVSWIRNYADYAQYVCLECKQDFYYPPKTIFHQITQSPEVLAEDLVYESGVMWMSTLITDTTFDTYEEAFAATLAILNAPVESEVKDE